MTDLVFFYGTLMTPFNRAGRLRVDQHLVYTGRGTIAGALFDLGIYPAAVPASDARVWGEVYRMDHPTIVLQALDELEGCRAEEPESSLYNRDLTPVTLDDGRGRRRVGVFLQRAARPRRADPFRRLPRTPESQVGQTRSGPGSAAVGLHRRCRNSRIASSTRPDAPTNSSPER